MFPSVFCPDGQFLQKTNRVVQSMNKSADRSFVFWPSMVAWIRPRAFNIDLSSAQLWSKTKEAEGRKSLQQTSKKVEKGEIEILISFESISWERLFGTMQLDRS